MPTTQRIEFYRHSLGDEEKRRILAALDDTILTTGATTAEVERALADALDVAEVVGLSSCTAALHLALLAEGIGPGDEVIVPAMTFVATANAVLMAGAIPVFADVDPRTACLTAETVAPRITARTRAIIAVHMYGLLCRMEELSSLAREHDIALMEDSAHCIEAYRADVRPASHSRCACFSFYATKTITCGEGGALATNDPVFAERVRRLSLHGMTTTAADRHHKRYQHWDVPEPGWKYNLDNIRAALLLPQIAGMKGRWERRRNISSRYEEAFDAMAGVDVQAVDEEHATARHLFPIWVDPAKRDEIIGRLQDRNIGIAVNYRAVHLLRYFAQRFGYKRGALPVAESIGDRTISIPLYPKLTDEQVERVIEAVNGAVAESQLSTRSDVSDVVLT